MAEGVAGENIAVTGNTVIDALRSVTERLGSDRELAGALAAELHAAGYDTARLDATGRRLVLVTGHRRENFGEGFLHICNALRDLALRYPAVDFVYPLHLNPNVRRPVHEVFGGPGRQPENMFFIEPLEYLSFVCLMERAHIVLTDSGGIQEEAPGLGKPVLVMRDTTERPEAVEAGTVRLVGTDYEKKNHHLGRPPARRPAGIRRNGPRRQPLRRRQGLPTHRGIYDARPRSRSRRPG